MSTSDIDTRKKALKTAFVYLLASLFFIFFGAVYERYSHEVYSYYMIYAFVFPLAGGTLPFLTIALLNAKGYPGAVAGLLYHTGIAVLTVGSVLRGVLDIYGTSNHLLGIYWYLGIALTVIGAVLVVVRWIMGARDGKRLV